MQQGDIKLKIKNYFINTSDYKPEYDENLFETGALDSFGVVEFLDFLENELGVSVNIEEITAENFSTIDSIYNLIKQ